jgi:aconitate hydratase
MGQAPASGRNSLRTVPRNFPGRSGAKEDSVFLCSPETATASALTGRITDPRELDMAYPRIAPPGEKRRSVALLEAPLPADEAAEVELVKSDNIESLPEFEALPDEVELPVLLTLGDHVSTDEILPAGSRVLPYRSNIPRISDFAFDQIDPDYPDKAKAAAEDGPGHALIAGRNYGQGSSREHAVIATRYLGLRVVMAESIARIHQQNLANFGVLPLTLRDPQDRERLADAERVKIAGIHAALDDPDQESLEVEVDGGQTIDMHIALGPRQRALVRAGGLINHAS